MQGIRAATGADLARLVLVGAIWGSSFLCIDIALTGLPPTSIVAGRLLLGALVLVAMLWSGGQRLPTDLRIWGLLVVIGFLNSALPFMLISWGQQFISGGRSAILMAAGPFLVVLMSHLWTQDDRLTAPKLGGMLLGFSGVILLVGYDAVFGRSESLAGQMAVIGATACYGVSAILTRHVASVPPLVNSAIVLASAACYMVPAALLIDHTWALQPAPTPLLAVVWLGLFPTALAYLLRFQIIQAVGATFMSQVSYMVPMFAILWGWLFLSQVPPGRAWIALTLIMGGLYLSRRPSTITAGHDR
jgi:drug/metabolite transporter (DMT)-like permease